MTIKIFILAVRNTPKVISAMRNPFPGWVENLNGPSGVVVATGKGLLHVFPGNCGVRADLLPVDIAVDTLIAVAWETAVDKSKEVRVYNCSTIDNPTTFEQFESNMFRVIARHPLDGVLWYPTGSAVQSEFVRKLLEFVLQTLPFHIVERTSQLIGIKTPANLITAGKRLTAMADALEFFATREFHFETSRVRALRDRLSPADSAIYNLDVKSINWNTHYEEYVKGVRKYLLREKDQDLEAARRRMRKMWLLHQVFKLLLLLPIIRAIMKYCCKR